MVDRESQNKFNDRFLQRQTLYSVIEDEGVKRTIRTEIPSGKLMDYGTGGRNSNLELADMDKLVEMMDKYKGGGVRMVLAVATMARDSYQVINALGALGGLANRITESHKYPAIYGEQARTISGAFDDFVSWDGGNISELGVSSGGRKFKEEIVKGYEEWRMEMNYGKDDLIGTEIEMILKKMGFFRADRSTSEYSVEALIAALCDKNTPKNVKTALLLGAGYYNFTKRCVDSDSYKDTLFGEKASFWKSFDGSWFLPEIISVDRIVENEEDNLKDVKINDLRVEVERLQKELKKINLSKEKILKEVRDEMMDRLKPILTNAEERVRLYRKLGGHPFDLLGISTNEWRDSKDREDLVRTKYRTGAWKYHYQVPESDPSFNSEMKELKNREFARITEAWKYLEKHLDEDQF